MTTLTTETAINKVRTSSFPMEHTPYSRLPKIKINPLNSLNLLTLRGLALALLLLYFATQLTIAQNDILAAVFTSSLGLILIFSLIITLIWGHILRSSLSISSLHTRTTGPLRASLSSTFLSSPVLSSPVLSSTVLSSPILSSGLLETSSTPTSQSPPIEAGLISILTLSLSRLNLPPFYRIKAEITLSDGFSNSTNIIKSSSEIISGDNTPDSKSTAIFRLRFPHRGEWQVKKLQLTLSDRFGLTKKRWSISESSLAQAGGLQVSVDPANPPRQSANLPIIASRDREGDTLNQSNTKLGEPFDLKRYNPSDGLKKVVWKVFARSGELISRHPESAMTPEGECYIFVVAGPNATGDQVVRYSLDYCNALEDASVELRLGCAGSTTADTATCSSQALTILRRNAWEANQDKRPQTMSLSYYLRAFLSKQPVNPPIQRLIFFLSPQDQNEETQIIEALLELERQSISPILMITSPSITRHPESYTSKSNVKPLATRPRDDQSRAISRLISIGKAWFFSNDSTTIDNPPEVTYLRLLQVSSQHGWQIYINRDSN